MFGDCAIQMKLISFNAAQYDDYIEIYWQMLMVIGNVQIVSYFALYQYPKCCTSVHSCELCFREINNHVKQTGMYVIQSTIEWAWFLFCGMIFSEVGKNFVFRSFFELVWATSCAKLVPEFMACWRKKIFVTAGASKLNLSLVDNTLNYTLYRLKV